MAQPRDNGLAGELSAGLVAQGLLLSEEQQSRLLEFTDLLFQWNKTHNLTAIRSQGEMVIRHLLDSLAIASFVKTRNLLDVGSGAGLPAIPLAIALPELEVCALDASQKRIAFVRHVQRSLGLGNLRAVHARVEDYSDQQFDCICSRAFSSLEAFTRLSAHLLADGGHWLAMKGQHPADELAELPATIRVAAELPLQVPGLEANRCVLVLEKY